MVPFLRHAGFVGREEDLAALHALLLNDGPVVGVLPVAASGMGGIGKTQLAVEYAYRYAGEYPGGVYWVNAANTFQAELAALAERVGLREDGRAASRQTRPAQQQRLALAFAGFLRLRRGRWCLRQRGDRGDPLSLRDRGHAVVPVRLACRLLFTTRRRERSGLLRASRCGCCRRILRFGCFCRVRCGAGCLRGMERVGRRSRWGGGSAGRWGVCRWRSCWLRPIWGSRRGFRWLIIWGG